MLTNMKKWACAALTAASCAPALAGDGLDDATLERFWTESSGKELRRLPVTVVPENAFCSLSKVSFQNDSAFEEQFVADLADRSVYNVITLTLRSVPDLGDKITEERVANYVRRAHEKGVQVLMDIDARIARREFLRRWPADHAGVMRLATVVPTNGVAHFDIRFGYYRDHMAWGADRAYDPSNGRILRALVLKSAANGAYDWSSVRDLTDAIKDVTSISNRVSGSVAGLKPNERLALAVGFDLFAADPCSENLSPFLRELAQRYHALGADGAMRDEWGFPPMREYLATHSAVPCTKRFVDAYVSAGGGRDYVGDMLKAFAAEKGGEASCRASIDALHRAIYTTIVRTEQEFYDLNKQVFGPDTYVTKHPTWYTRICQTEFLHNGLDWWATARDWAQSDEAVPIPCISGMAKRRGGPCWMNEGYGPSPEHYGRAMWKYALCGGRMVYHGIYGGGGDTSVKKQKLTPNEAKRHGSLDILTAGNVLGQARICLLNLISRAQVDCPTALVFGHARVMNWFDPTFENGGLALAHALADTGRYVDSYPSSEFPSFTVDSDGFLRMGQQRYTALVLHGLDATDVAAFGKLIAGKTIKTMLFSWDSPEVAGARVLASGTDTAPIVAALDAAGATRQTPLTPQGLHPGSEDHLPAPDGTLRLIDGTVARLKGASPDFGGDRIEGVLKVGSVEIPYEAEGGVFAVRLDAEGKAVALAAGGLRMAVVPGLGVIRLDRGEDLALVRIGNKWRGLWQTADAAETVPAALRALTDDWRILRLPAHANPATPSLDVSRPGIRNPERGWRFEIEVALEPGEKSYVRDNWPFPRYRRDGVTISQAYCYLTKYAHTPIPKSKLDALQADFDRARREGVKFLLRFAYERNQSRMSGPYLHEILAHIAQLKDVVRRNADVIYCLQTGWVGAWGEFHSSMSGIEKDPKKVAKIVAATLDMLPANRKTMMRYPLIREQALKELDGVGEDRIGLFYDATLANTVESGTFLDYPDMNEKRPWDTLLWSKYAETGNYHYDLAKRIGQIAPVDGELFWTHAHVNPARDTALRAILRFREHHYTTFSLVHNHSELDFLSDPGAIDRWKATPLTADMLKAYGIDCDPDYFAGVPHRTGYEFIRDHLGYRLVAKGVSVEKGIATVVVHNYGFAAPVNPRKVHLAILRANGPVETVATDFDCRKFVDGKDTVLSAGIPVLAAGDRLALWLPDEMMPMRPEYAIRLAGGVEIVERDGRVLNVLR